MTTMIEVGSVIAVGYEDVKKTMTEVGWGIVVGYEDLKKTAGHFSKWIKVTLVLSVMAR